MRYGRNLILIWKKGAHPKNERYHKLRAIRRLLNYQIVDVINQSKKNIEDLQITSVESLQDKGFRVISFSPEVKEEVRQLRLFLKENLYHHPKVKEMTDQAKAVIRFLFEAYQKNPTLMPGYFAGLTQKTQKKRPICDYIAGMTDRFAHKEFERLGGKLS